MRAPPIISRFGASVRDLRHQLGISQETLAERADLHRTYIAGIEAGTRNVTLKCVDKLARALEVSTATLFLHASKPGGRAKSAGGGRPGVRCVDILIVEDNQDDVDLTLAAFQQARISNPVQVVRDGAEALDFLFCEGAFASRTLVERPQLVLLDLNLPKVSGIEVLRRLKADRRTRGIPVIVLTVSDKDRDIAECRRLGAETYIVKPVDFVALGQATPQLDLNWALLKPPEARPRRPRASLSV
jgi:two-component system response regulator